MNDVLNCQRLSHPPFCSSSSFNGWEEITDTEADLLIVLQQEVVRGLVQAYARRMVSMRRSRLRSTCHLEHSESRILVRSNITKEMWFILDFRYTNAVQCITDFYRIEVQKRCTSHGEGGEDSRAVNLI